MTKDETYNASNEQHVKDAEKKEKQVRDRDKRELAHLMQNVQFRRFLWRYMGACGLYRSSAEPSGSMTYFNEGKRIIGLTMQKEAIEANQSAYLQMIKEEEEAKNG